MNGFDMSDVRIKVTSWEANGYDDSDWDTIYFFPDTKKIVHDEGTTRGYCEGNPEVFARKTVLSVSEAVYEGIATEDEIRFALLADTLKSNENRFEILPTSYVHNTLSGCWSYIPCTVRKARSNEVDFNGVVLYFNKDGYKQTFMVFDTDNNKLCEVNARLVEFDDKSVSKLIADTYIKYASLNDICRYISSYNSCSSSRYDFYVSDIKKVVSLRLAVEISDEVKVNYLNEKRESIRKWAMTLGNKTENEINRIVECTIRKHYSQWVA